MNKINLAGKVLLGVLMVFFLVLSLAWLNLTGDEPRLTNADYFERIGWMVATITALFLKGPAE